MLEWFRTTREINFTAANIEESVLSSISSGRRRKQRKPKQGLDTVSVGASIRILDDNYTYYYDDDAAEYENAPGPNEINNEDQMISSVKPVEMLDHTEPVTDSADNSTEEQTESNEAVTASAENMTVNAILKYLQDLQGKYSFHFSAESLQLNPT